MKKRSLFFDVEQSKKTRQRRLTQTVFKFSSFFAAGLAMLALIAIIFSIGSKGYKTILATEILLPITINPIDDDLTGTIKKGVAADFKATNRKERKLSYELISTSRNKYSKSKDKDQGYWTLASGLTDSWHKGYFEEVDGGPLSESQLSYLEGLKQDKRLRYTFATNFFFNADSRYPELAGIKGAALGSLMTLFVALILAFPISTLAAIYLAEYAKPSRFMSFIETNINNLASVPAVIFGLLGLLILLQKFSLPRSSPMVGGIVLAALILPVLIISSRAAIEAIPDSLREAAYALGASKMQTIMHHVLPNALPGILTGAILGTAQMIGESAPLLMIGMVAFIADVPQSFSDSATALPVQIFLWADSPERGFIEKTSGAIIALLLILVVINLIAQIMRKKFEKKW